MIYYRDQDGKVYVYESEADRERFGPPSLVKMTAAEVEAHRGPRPTPEKLAEVKARSQRDGLLAATDWIVVRAQELGQPVPQSWLDYRQALRDLPEQPGFPMEITWPERPSDDA